MIFVNEAQTANWETSALTTPGNLALQYFETWWVTTTLLVQGGLKVASASSSIASASVTTTLLVQGGLKVRLFPVVVKAVGNNNPPSTGWVESFHLWH